MIALQHMIEKRSSIHSKETGQMFARRARTALTVLTCAMGVLLLLLAAPAFGKVVHQEEGSFDGHDRPTFGVFESGFLPSAAVEQASGDAWVTEAKIFGSIGKGDAVDEFNEKGEYAGVQLTGAGTPQGEFNFGGGLDPGIAVDNAVSSPGKGDLYVSDTGNGVVDRFSQTGSFECQITGRKPATPEEEKHECDGAAGSEPAGGAGIEPAGLAVDSSGDVYVADRDHDVIDVFGPSGEYKDQIADSHLSSLGTIALDSAGDLYVTNITENVVKFGPSGHFEAVVNEGDSPAGVAVDPTNGHVYVGVLRENQVTKKVEHMIAEYAPASSIPLDYFAAGALSGGLEFGYFGIAVGPGGRVYAAEPINGSGAGVLQQRVLIFGPGFVVPNTTTGTASEAGETSATLHGHLDPAIAEGAGEATGCQFEFGLTTAYGEATPCVPGPDYSSPTDVSAHLVGLRPSSVYHFRVAASNSNHIPSDGEDETFVTSGAPSVDFETAEALNTSATFKAEINPWGHDTACRLEYVDDADFKASEWAQATTTPCSPEEIGQGFGDVTVKFTVGGLARATTYHYRFLATNQDGRSAETEASLETYGIRKVSLQFLHTSQLIDPSSSGEWNVWEAGEPELQAGAHPYELVTDIIMSHTTEFSHCAPIYCSNDEEIEVVNNTAVDTKDIKVELPPGVIGNPTALPKCNRTLVAGGECPSDTEVGVVEVWTDYPLGRRSKVWPLPEENEGNRIERYTQGLFNLEPSERVPAEFGAFIEGKAPVWIPFHVRTGSDYGITADSLDITALGGGTGRVRVRVWGVPTDPAHELERGEHCPTASKGVCSDELPLTPLITNPTSCEGPLGVTASADSWQEPGQYVSKKIEVAGFTGCDRLQFEPKIEATPTTDVADSPSGLNVDLHIPQPAGCKEEAGKVVCENAEAELKDATVTFPAGLTVNPSSADGLGACSEEEIGFNGGFAELNPASEPGVRTPQFSEGPEQCPDASKIGSVQIDTPLIAHPLTGAMYLARQHENPFGSLLAVYLTVYDPITGVVVKLPGVVQADPQSGRLTVTFDQNPQLPFEDLKVDLFSGSRSPLTTALACGSYAASTALTPWTAPEGATATPSSLPFQVSGAPGGGGCAGSEGQAPNAPTFAAGMASPIAGSYSPFVLKLAREDGSQRFSALNVTLPPGLIGRIAGVEECSQGAIEAAQGRSREGEGAVELAHPSCSAGSEVGVVHVGTGSGAPYYVTGHAFFAGPYDGAPFSLVFVTPAIAGPFDLGAVVVRAGLYIDPHTATVTVKSDPFPTILDGIPLDIRSIAVEANRKEFTLNPTSCGVLSVIGQESSTAGQVAGLSDRFQAGGCTTLPFHPSFSASTSGVTSKADGASLTALVKYPAGSLGTQANVKSVRVELPKSLPSRLTTLQKACTAKAFESNPASCPAESVIGHAVVHTPVLSVPLEGPAYFVSHGGEAFPNLVVILQGDGVTVDLTGDTDIKDGITSTTFAATPDVPFESFELALPRGKYSALTANGNLCQQTLLMPTAFVAQNGATLNQTTHIEVAGCGNSLSIVSKSVKGKVLTLRVALPGAGRLKVAGKGLSSVIKSAHGRETVVVKLNRKRAGKLKTKVKLTFLPSNGKTLTKSLSVSFKKTGKKRK